MPFGYVSGSDYDSDVDSEVDSLQESVSSLSLRAESNEIPPQDPNDGSDAEPILARILLAGTARFANSGLIAQRSAEIFAREVANVAAQHTHPISVGYYLEIIQRGPVTDVPCLINEETATGCSIHPDTYSPDCTAPWVPFLEESLHGQSLCFLSIDVGTEPRLSAILVYVVHSWAMTAMWQCISFSEDLPRDGNDKRKIERHAQKTVQTWVGDVITLARLWDTDPEAVVAMYNLFLEEN